MNNSTRRVIGSVGLIFGVLLGAPALGVDAQPSAEQQPRVVSHTSDHTWAFLERAPDLILKSRPLARPAKGQVVQVDLAKLREAMRAAPLEGTPRAKTEPAFLELPLPDGSFERFNAIESPLMHPELAAKYPEIKTYLIWGIDDPLARGRAMIAPEGFHATFYTSADMVSIQRLSIDNNQYHTSYWYSEYFDHPVSWNCGTNSGTINPAIAAMRPRNDRGVLNPSSRSGETRSEYYFALAATGEYVEQFGTGAGETRRASIVTLFNQMLSNVNVEYEHELSVRMILANGSDQLVQLDPSFNDAFTNPENVSQTQNQGKALFAAVIGNPNFHVGQVIHFTQSGNGNAGAIGSVCADDTKGLGYSATDTNRGAATPFDVVIVAHELGHQFAGRHNFNNCSGGPREDIMVTPEPGSGSTIMSYTGICPGTNLAMQPFPVFSQLNFDQMFSYISTGPGAACPVALTSTGNHPPTVEGGPDYVIPSKTPYALTASANDSDNDTLTYSWETKNVGPVIAIPLQPVSDNGLSPINRFFMPTTSPTRSVPQLAQLLNPNPADIADMLPQVNRMMEWRVTVRDNHPGSGGVATDDVNVEVVGFAGPFRVLTPSAGASVSGVINVTWDPASTNLAPIDCQNVRILLSTDGGNTYPINLLASTPNTGTAQVVLPNLTAIQARLKVESIGNIFFNISPGNFTINPPTPGVSFRQQGTASINDTTGNGNSTGNADPGETSVRVLVPILNAGGTTATGVSGTLTTTTPTASIVSGFSLYPPLPYGQIGQNLESFVISIDPSHPCGTPINLRLTLNSLEGTAGSPINFTIPTGSTGGAGQLLSFSFVGNPIAIPNNNATGITVPFNVSAFGTIADVDLRFDGSTCSALINDPLVGLTHTFVGDLVISLTSPQGTTVILADRPGRQLAPTTGSSGNNFCQTNFNDDGNFLSIQAISPAAAPYTGAFKPFQPLSAFDGQSANGVWQLKIADVNGLDTGIFRSATLRLTPNNPPGCTLPAATGACCIGASCSITNAGDCAAQSGSYTGNATSCSPSPCAAAPGACCLGSTCSVVADAGACAAGSFSGAGVACNPGGNFTTPCCKANFNQVSGVTVQDVFDFLNAWFAGSASTDFNGSGVTVQDVFDFLSAWFNGCP